MAEAAPAGQKVEVGQRVSVDLNALQPAGVSMAGSAWAPGTVTTVDSGGQFATVQLDQPFNGRQIVTMYLDRIKVQHHT